MLQRFLDNYHGLTGLTLSAWQRAQIAAQLTVSEATVTVPSTPPNPPPPVSPEDSRFYVVQDEFGDMSVTAIRQWVSIHDKGYEALPEDDLLARFQLKSGKLAEPACSDLGPFYMVSHVGQPGAEDYRTSARDMRRVIRSYYDDNWNVYPTEEIERVFSEKTGRALRRV